MWNMLRQSIKNRQSKRDLHNQQHAEQRKLAPPDPSVASGEAQLTAMTVTIKQRSGKQNQRSNTGGDANTDLLDPTCVLTAEQL